MKYLALLMAIAMTVAVGSNMKFPFKHLFKNPLKKDLVLFTGMQGKMTYKGQPAANAKIIRREYWTTDEGDDEIFYTDENGNFDLPIKLGRTWFYGDLQINQRIMVEIPEEPELIRIWSHGKQNPHEYGEWPGGKPVNFRCELTDPYEDHDFVIFIPTVLHTRCKWDKFEKVEPFYSILMDFYKARQ